MPSLKRRIATLQVKARRHSEASLKAEQRRIQLRENKARREAERHAKYGKAEAAREQRREKLDKAKDQLWSAFVRIGKQVGKASSKLMEEDKPRRRKKSGKTAKRTRR